MTNNLTVIEDEEYQDPLSVFNNQIASTNRLLNSIHMSCKRERREIEKGYNEKTRLDALVTHFKNNNDEYLKI
jgi:3-methyladenine DNA glycosylase/8-oxoguanine DNA glycosylase